MKNKNFKVYKQDMKFMQHKNNILATKKKKKREKETTYLEQNKYERVQNPKT